MASLENRITDEIRLALSETCVLARSPAGLFYQGKRTREGLANIRPVKVLVKGWPDLTGYRRSDGKAVFIEVKTPDGKKRPEQIRFIELAKKAGCLAGFARSVEDARRIVDG